ncbi:uncharacterized protein LOC116293541 [Actinia tenebrosa]|uniref:Uncharacterized protein LOC116293541 n=1 Tax=Actinia tenebrosa TaxID=6105 RepID=A0A6P8HMB2_ACTTE|nr:uncharacterized protein LOC116293541 [Actinia tenebrosa]
MAEFLKSEKILKVVSCIIYGISTQVQSRNRHGCGVRQCLMSGPLVAFLWYSFAFEMYCIKTYWRNSSLKPQIPLETLLIMIPLTLSGAITYTLMVWYFYSNDFQHSHTRLVPHFDFMPEGHQEDIGPTRNDWKYVNNILLIGFTSVGSVFYCCFGLNVFFDFSGIHNFAVHIHDWKKTLYYIDIGIIYWGYISAVVACCIFFICCRDIVRHIEFTETLIITKAKKYLTARHYHECLLRYTDDVMNTTKLWFVVHSLFFAFIVLTDAVAWIMAFSEINRNHKNMVHIIMGQTAGSFLIAFKFAFPFLAASRVTAQYDKMYRRINRHWRPDVLSEVDAFMNYAIRCEAGFTLFGIKLTAELALISLLSCFLGFCRIFKNIA